MKFFNWIQREICSPALLIPAVALILLVALSGCGGKSSPTEPGPLPTPTPTIPGILTISPTSTTLTPGASKTFSATGGISSFYSWTATGGTLSSASGSTVTYTAGSAVGTYTVQVQNGTVTAVATVTVNAISPTPTPTPTPTPSPTPAPQNSLTFISVDVPSGSTLKVGDWVTVAVSYNALQSGSIGVFVSGINGGGSTGQGNPVSVGQGTVQARCSSTVSGTSTSILVRMLGPDFLPVTTLEVPLTYTWQ